MILHKKRPTTVQNWMKLCGHQQEFDKGNSDGISRNVDWCAAGKCYDNLQEMPSFVVNTLMYPMILWQIHINCKESNSKHTK